MKIVKTVKEYQLYINEVVKTQIPIKVKVEMTDEELEKRNELDIQGVDIIVGIEYDEIKSV